MIGANQQLAILKGAEGAPDAEGVVSRSWDLSAQVVGFLHNRSVREMVDGVYMTVEQWQAYMPAGTTITYKDAIIDEGWNLYRVVDAVPRRAPSGAVHHVSVTLTKATA